MLHPVIMAGGSGTRFWPKSRLRRPKQLIQIVGNGTMVQQTVARLAGLPKHNILVVTNASQADAMRTQLPDLAPEQIVAEPCGRDTAACIGLAAFMVKKRDPDAVMAICAADHAISPAAEFVRCIEEAARLASECHVLVTFGVKPTQPSTRFGYVRRGAALSGAGASGPVAYSLLEFKEKPEAPQAQAFYDTGEYYWNSGNFVWRADDIIAAIATHMPELHAGLERIDPALGTPEQAAAIEREYPGLPRNSIDYGVMEKADNAVIVEATFEWDDVGAWDAVHRHHPTDANDNVVVGEHVGKDTQGCILVAEDGHLLATLGVRDLIVVQTDNATLVCDRKRAPDVKALVELLKEQGRDAYL